MVTNNNNNNNNNKKLKIKNVEGPVIIYSLVGGEFWRITRFLGGEQRRISLRPQRMTEEDHRELNVDELEMRAEGWGS